MSLDKNTKKGMMVGGIVAGGILLAYIINKRRKEDPEKYSADDFDPDQVRRGIEVEREHANTVAMIQDHLFLDERLPTDDEIFESIAKDHLKEFGNYYDRLDKMEEKANKDKKEHYGVATGEKKKKKKGWHHKKVGKIKKISKDQLKKLEELIDIVPKEKGWSTYYQTELEPKFFKFIKALVITGGVVTASFGGLPLLMSIGGMALINKINKNNPKLFKRLSKVDDKALKSISKIVDETMGRFMTIAKVYLVNDQDMKKTIDAIKTKQFNAVDVDKPKVKIDWDKVDEGKLFTAVLLFADDAIPLASAAGGVATAETGVGAVVGGAGAGVTGTVAVATDVIAVMLIIEAIRPAVDIKNPE